MVKKDQILKFISDNEVLFRNKYYLAKIGLFGSFARDEQNELSDIDLIVEFEPGTKNLHQIKKEIIELFKTKFNVSVDICREKYIKPIFKEQILRESVYGYHE
jgi:predicted nucleotidyltransferase